MEIKDCCISIEIIVMKKASLIVLTLCGFVLANAQNKQKNYHRHHLLLSKELKHLHRLLL